MKMTVRGDIWRSILAIVVGLVLVIWPGAALNYIVIFLGVILLVGGAVALAAYLSVRKQTDEVTFPIAGTVSGIIGLLLIFFPSFFVSALMVVLGILLIIAAASEVSILIQARKAGFVVAAWNYIVPVLILIGGVVVLFDPFTSATTVFVLFGIMSMVYGAIDLYNQYAFLPKK